MAKGKKKTADGLRFRSLSLRLDAGGLPQTLDVEGRSVEAVGATETPVDVYDWELGGAVGEVLLMSGCRVPESGRVVLLDSHGRWETRTVVGSFREMRIEGGELVGRAVFSATAEGEAPFTKLREGHLTDFSIGFRINACLKVKPGETTVVDGREFSGPLRVVTDWTPRELSVCPIGADENAKARALGQLEENMDERLRKFLESRGLSPEAGEDEAWRFLEGLETRAEGEGGGASGQAKPGETRKPEDGNGERAEPEFQVDVAAVCVDAARAEQGRILAIRSMCETFGVTDMADKLIQGNTPLDQARTAVMDRMASRSKEDGMPGFQVSMGATGEEKFRAAATDALRMRGGRAVEKPAPGAMDLRSLMLREHARECLRQRGERIPSDLREMVGRALTSSDFPLILADASLKSLMDGWEQAQETWPLWVDDSGVVTDFKIHTMVRAGESDDLDEIGESEEYKYGSRTEAQEQYQIATYGKMFAISRQTIINDDLGALTGIPALHGEACARKLGDIAYAVLLSNAKMGDGVALFHATHKNLQTAAAISVDSLGAAETAMSLQKDIGGKRRLNIPAAFLLAPVTVKTKTEQFFATELIGGAANQPNIRNTYYGEKIARVYEPRLDDDSVKAWYLAARKGKTVRMFFLNGVKTPFLESRLGWNVDGAEYKVRIDAGAKAVDWRGVQKNPGL